MRKSRLASLRSTAGRKSSPKNSNKGANSTGRGARTVKAGNRKTSEKGRPSRRFV